MDDDTVIEVLENNLITVQVFELCEWIIHIGMSTKPYYQGIHSREIHSALMMLRVIRSEWPRIVRGIQFHMVPSAKKHLNQD